MVRAQTNTDKAWLKQRMKEAGYTARSMAPLLDMDFTVFSRMLNGQRHVRLAELRKIAEILGESEGEVLLHLDVSTISPRKVKKKAVMETRPKLRAPPVADSAMREMSEIEAESYHSTEECIVPPKGADPLFGCMAGTLTLLHNVDYAAPADPDWGRVYDD